MYEEKCEILMINPMPKNFVEDCKSIRVEPGKLLASGTVKTFLKLIAVQIQLSNVFGKKLVSSTQISPWVFINDFFMGFKLKQTF